MGTACAWPCLRSIAVAVETVHTFGSQRKLARTLPMLRSLGHQNVHTIENGEMPEQRV